MMVAGVVREMTAASKLHHPGIVEVFETLQPDTLPWVHRPVMAGGEAVPDGS